MSDIAIKVQGLGKRYRIGQTAGYKTLRDSLTSAVQAPFRRGPRERPAEADAKHIWALKDVSFEIKRGEAVGIIGKNGSGKSTLLKILSRITAPTDGYAEIHGRASSLLEVGTGFHPELSGRENIYLNGAVLGMKKAETDRRLEAIVAFSEIGQFLDTPVKRYSSGMYVRLAFAVAAHLEPDILLVDEVLAVGDAQFQKKCLGKMDDVTKEGRTVVFVSHSMMAVEHLCPRAILMKGGRAAAKGSTLDVISEYLDGEASRSDMGGDIRNPSLRQNSLSDSHFRWTGIRIEDSDKMLLSTVKFGEPFQISLRGFADRDLADLKVGFSVDSALGIPVFNSFQTDEGLPSRFVKGEIAFRVRIRPNLFAPGPYTISLAAVGEGIVDYLPIASRFSVSTVPIDAERRWEQHHGGLLRYPCTWMVD